MAVSRISCALTSLRSIRFRCSSRACRIGWSPVEFSTVPLVSWGSPTCSGARVRRRQPGRGCSASLTRSFQARPSWGTKRQMGCTLLSNMVSSPLDHSVSGSRVADLSTQRTFRSLWSPTVANRFQFGRASIEREANAVVREVAGAEALGRTHICGLTGHHVVHWSHGGNTGLENLIQPPPREISVSCGRSTRLTDPRVGWVQCASVRCCRRSPVNPRVLLSAPRRRRVRSPWGPRPAGA